MNFFEYLAFIGTGIVLGAIAGRWVWRFIVGGYAEQEARKEAA